jgi:glutamate carboxypeptidase
MARNEGSAALTALYLGAAAALGQGTQAEFTRSCADSGIASATGTPTVCALGPVGGHAHSPEEYVELGSFVPRAQSLALAIARLGAH